MRRLVLIGFLAGALGAGVAVAQPAPSPAKKAPAGRKMAATSAVADTSSGELAMGTIRLPKKVMADGQPLPAGIYQVRLTPEEAKPAVGETPSSERWVEFLQGKTVKGREIASVIPDSDIAQVAKGPGQPHKNGSRVDLLKQNNYWRVWINKAGTNVLVHLPPA